MKKTTYLAVMILLAGADPAASQDLYYTKAGSTACMSEADLDLFNGLAAAKDMEAMAKVVMSGRCVLLKAGIPVYRESLGFKSGSSGKIKIRPKGETESFWTTKSAIQKK